MAAAGTLVRTARSAAGLTQRQLASRVGNHQPAIAALESGVRDARVGTLDRLVAAAGGRLAVLPSRRAPVAETASEIRRAVQAKDDRLAYRLLMLVNDDLAAEHGAVRVALAVTPPEPTGDRRFDAFLAALVEHRLQEERLPFPTWIQETARSLAEPWFVSDIPAYTEEARRTSPAAFRRRNVFVTASELESV